MSMPSGVPLLMLGLMLTGGLGVRCLIHLGRHRSLGFAGLGTQPVLAVTLVAVVGVQALVEALAPRWLEPVLLPVPDVVRWSGAALGVLATAMMVLAQLDLGASWRIGIDVTARPGLVTRGFYQLCRNPIFLFMLTALVGAGFALPTVISVTLCLTAIFLVRRQVSAEEAWLRTAYGEAYRAFSSRIGRFTPWTGRLREG